MLGWPEQRRDAQWLMYWAVYGTFEVVERYTASLITWCALTSPQVTKGDVPGSHHCTRLLSPIGGPGVYACMVCRGVSSLNTFTRCSYQTINRLNVSRMQHLTCQADLSPSL